jgi:hypothetical protein
MRPRILASGGLMFVLLATSLSGGDSALLHPQPAKRGLTAARLESEYGKLPLRFEPNMGQFDARVRYIVRGGGPTVFLTDSEAVMVLTRREGRPGDRLRSHAEASKVEDAVVRMKFTGAQKPAGWAGLEKQPGISNYFIGNDPSRWHTDVPNYSRVEARDLYPGISLVAYGNAGHLEYDLNVAPGADPAQVQLAWEGADSLRLNADGDLVLATRLGEVVQKRPTVFQDLGGRRTEVASHYTMGAGNKVRFELAAYDHTRPLRIDPLVLVYSTYLGGHDLDAGGKVAVDSHGAAYITGGTRSTDFPIHAAEQGQYGGAADYPDAFITKLSPAGNQLVYSTYLGGNSSDAAGSIAVDASGCAYVAGETDSSNFPVHNAYQSKGNGSETFAAKLSAAGDALVYSTYVDSFVLTGVMAINQAGEAYITGGFGPPDHIAVVQLSADGGSVLKTFALGGTGITGRAIAVDGTGAVYITGDTVFSDYQTKAAWQGTFVGGPPGGGSDAFAAKFEADGTLVYSTFLGGSDGDMGSGIAVDASGTAYITGETKSHDFPTKAAYQGANTSGSYACFVAALTATGQPVYSTYLSGTVFDSCRDIAIDTSGNAYITGYTASPDFPIKDAYQSTPGDSSGDAFIAELNSAGDTLVFSSYLGGNRRDDGGGIARDSAGSLYIVGTTRSTNFPVRNPYQSVHHADSNTGTNEDVFIAKFQLGPGAPTVDLVSPSAGTGTAQTFTFRFSDYQGYAALNRISGSVGASLNAANGCGVKYVLASNALYLLNDTGSDSSGPITPGTSATLSNSQCRLDASGSAASGSGNTLTLVLSLRFESTFTGMKNVYGWAIDNANLESGWTRVGVWNPGNFQGVSPTADSVSPNSGAGTTQSFTFRFSSVNGSAYLYKVYGSVGTHLYGYDECRVQYVATSNQLYLLNEDGSGVLGPLTPGVAGTVNNSRCTLDGSGSSVSGSGNTLTVSAALHFSSGFTGAKKLWGRATDQSGNESGWEMLGTWTAGP